MSFSRNTALLLSLAGFLVQSASATTIAEYFWNTDPGIGNATQIQLEDPVNGITSGDFQTTVPSAPGANRLYLRVQQSDGQWGPNRLVNTYHVRDERPYERNQLASANFKLLNAAGETVFTSVPLIPMANGDHNNYDGVLPTGLLNLPSGDYTLVIVATHQNGQVAEHRQFLTLTPAPNSPPVLKFLSPPALNPIQQADTDSPGTLVSDLILQLQDPLQISDPNGDTLSLSIQLLDTENGYWQIQKQGESAWTSLKANSKSSVLLLLPTDRIRFVPQKEFVGTLSTDFRFHIWDQFAGGRLEEILIDSPAGQNTLSLFSGYATLAVEKRLHPLPTQARPISTSRAAAACFAWISIRYSAAVRKPAHLRYRLHREARPLRKIRHRFKSRPARSPAERGSIRSKRHRHFRNRQEEPEDPSPDQPKHRVQQ